MHILYVNYQITKATLNQWKRGILVEMMVFFGVCVVWKILHKLFSSFAFHWQEFLERNSDFSSKMQNIFGFIHINREIHTPFGRAPWFYDVRICWIKCFHVLLANFYFLCYSMWDEIHLTASKMTCISCILHYRFLLRVYLKLLSFGEGMWAISIFIAGRLIMQKSTRNFSKNIHFKWKITSSYGLNIDETRILS